MVNKAHNKSKKDREALHETHSRLELTQKLTTGAKKHKKETEVQ